MLSSNKSNVRAMSLSRPFCFANGSNHYPMCLFISCPLEFGALESGNSVTLPFYHWNPHCPPSNSIASWLQSMGLLVFAGQLVLGPLMLLMSTFLGIKALLGLWATQVYLVSNPLTRDPGVKYRGTLVLSDWGVSQKSAGTLSRLKFNDPISLIIWRISCCCLKTLSLIKSNVRALSHLKLPDRFFCFW